MAEAVTRQDILNARERLRGMAVRTPLLSFPVLDEASGRRVLVKPECLQRTGSFKFRGAFNRLSMIPADRRAAGVVACSSGNHAQGVAEAARLLGMPATIVMPEDAPAIKLARTRRLGAEVVTYRRGEEDREAIAADLCRASGATFVHPFNDPGVIAGQGTVGLEMAEQARELGVEPDAIVSCTGGGGLTGGIALALEDDLPACRVFTAEPEGFDDYARSLAAGRRLENARTGGSVCDAILTERPGETGFAILSRRRASGLVVSDREALAAVAFAFSELKLVVEPGGAVALAAVLGGKVPAACSCVALVLSGGNVDPQMMMRALALAL
ncbi:threonine ammonia-lyase [Polymorphum gilvum]|uniref:Threonine dehydratase catabolic, TdcB n=1 Tax=Polymorphum gilvum (strain LMG 25793 / CGMCC 1.9160 / SL003B-26A1) TaxID=991905 RepID=F2J3A8_POLGS|nr:threonine/serine dehydratase [Polymorphum gilvum]ADZ69915.1 Threonine dehydratase catabolic, TdcB [Polymorphum gilvum SL003B-26A1]